MPIQTLLSELDRKIILFSYENSRSETQPISIEGINDDLRTFVITEGEYILWELNKRKLDESEIVTRSWVLNSQNSHSFLVNFNENKTLTVKNLFSDLDCVGDWLLENGILKIAFYYQETEYNITVIANNCELVHSALQINEKFESELLRIVPLRQSRKGSSISY